MRNPGNRNCQNSRQDPERSFEPFSIDIFIFINKSTQNFSSSNLSLYFMSENSLKNDDRLPGEIAAILRIIRSGWEYDRQSFL